MIFSENNNSDSINKKILNNKAKAALELRDLRVAYAYFKKAGNILGCGYCEFLNGNFPEAEIILKVIKNLNPYAEWLLFLIDLCKEKKGTTTYFKIRNFYEQDLDMLFGLGKDYIVNNITSKIDYLSNFNGEVYKYTARVMFNNNRKEEALLYLKKSTDICYNDPETHYMTGEIYEKNGEKEKALKEYDISAKMFGGYLPAEKKIKELTKRL